MDDCVFTRGKPCCTTHWYHMDEEWWKLSWAEKIQKQKNMACPIHNYGFEYEGKDICFFADRDITCPG